MDIEAAIDHAREQINSLRKAMKDREEIGIKAAARYKELLDLPDDPQHSPQEIWRAELIHIMSRLSLLESYQANIRQSEKFLEIQGQLLDNLLSEIESKGDRPA